MRPTLPAPVRAGSIAGGALATLLVAASLLSLQVPAPPADAALPAPPTAAPPASDGGAASPSGPSGPSLADLNPSVTPTTVTSASNAYPTYNAAGTFLANANWDVVTGTGNCCEQYVAALPGGRLVNFGGTYLYYTDNAGTSWTRVAPADPLVTGEGAVSAAPNGDIVGVGWDVYGGDHLQGFKYTAATNTWRYAESPVHSPAFDRPWLAVIPGPFTVGGTTYPYVSIVKGGTGAREVSYISLDGLTYVLPSSPSYVDRFLKTAVTATVAPASYADGDWVQPNAATGIAPLGPAAALSQNTDYPYGYPFTGCQWRTFQPDLHWACYTPATPLVASSLLADGSGRLHRLGISGGGTSFTYGISTDGGVTWTGVTTSLPASNAVESWDFKTNANLDITAVAIHAHDSSSATDRDYVYKFDVATATPSLTKRYNVGAGNLDAGNNVASSGSRFDFCSVAILSTGKIATAFIDAAHSSTALAIEN